MRSKRDKRQERISFMEAIAEATQPLTHRSLPT
jgi:hypothetical protein